jgi:creatinine amidohydrolase
MQIMAEFEDNAVGNLKRELWEASDAEIETILKDYDIPSLGEMDRPGCYVQTTLPGIQQKRVDNNDIVLIPLGSTERHGYHSVLAQDLLQVTRICEATRRYTAK